MQNPKLLNLDYWYFMLKTVVPAKTTKLAKTSLDVSLYYCQDMILKALQANPEALTANVFWYSLQNEQNQCFFEETVLQASLDVHWIGFNIDVYLRNDSEDFGFALWHRLYEILNKPIEFRICVCF